MAPSIHTQRVQRRKLNLAGSAITPAALRMLRRIADSEEAPLLGRIHQYSERSLERQGLIYGAPDSADPRLVRWYLTEQGWKVIEAARDQPQAG